MNGVLLFLLIISGGITAAVFLTVMVIIIKDEISFRHIVKESHMKTKEEVQKKCIGNVYTLEEFSELCEDGLITSYDGHGYFHDGEKETDVNVFADADPDYVWKHYRYVCWYNK